MSRLTDSRSSSSPAGSPSTMQVRPGPWLSPAVTTRSDTAESLGGGRGPPPEQRLALETGGEAGRLDRGDRRPDRLDRSGARGRRAVAARAMDLDQVQLVGRGDVPELVDDVEELGLAGAQADELALAGVAAA